LQGSVACPFCSWLYKSVAAQIGLGCVCWFLRLLMFGEGKLSLLIDTLHNAGCETVCVTKLIDHLWRKQVSSCLSPCTLHCEPAD